MIMADVQMNKQHLHLVIMKPDQKTHTYTILSNFKPFIHHPYPLQRADLSSALFLFPNKKLTSLIFNHSSSSKCHSTNSLVFVSQMLLFLSYEHFSNHRI